MSPESETASPLAEPNPSLASPGAAFAGGCQELGGLRTEAAERNNVAKTTILHACSTENRRVRSEPRPSPDSVFSVASVVDSISVPGIDWQQVVHLAREWGAARYVGLTLHLARSLLDAGVPDDVLERLVPGGLDQRVLETARQSVLAQTGYGPWTPFFDLRGARSLGDKVKLFRKRVFLSRDEMAAIYPASRDSRHLYLYYALRLKDVMRVFWSHNLRRGLPMIRSRGQDRNVSLVNWLKSGPERINRRLRR